MKKILCLILVFVLLFSLASCGSGPSATVKKLCEGLRSYDFDKIEECVETVHEGSNLRSLESDPTTSKLMEYFKKWASGITYKIGDTNINGDSATVKVDFKYGDASDIMTSALGGLMKKALELAMKGETPSEDDVINMLLECIDEAEKTTKLGEKEATVTFELVKQGSDWKVTGPNQELLPIFTSHALDAMRNLLN